MRVIANSAPHARFSQRPFAPHRVEQTLDVELRLLVEGIYGPPASHLNGLDIGRAYWGANQEFRYGGDLVDVFHYGNGLTSLAVVDISGHGILAARHAGLVKHALRAYASCSFSAIDSIRALNRLCIENCAYEGEIEFFATAFFAIVDSRRETMEYVSAGHEAAFIVKAGGHRLLEATGPILGLLDDDHSFHQKTVKLDNADVLVAVTDGFAEARNESLAFLGADAIIDIIRRTHDRSAAEQAQAVTAVALEFAGTRLQDDIAALVAKITRP
jgi:sigma-B regulation protein RsbU (phosphoserine phosphatase)